MQVNPAVADQQGPDHHRQVHPPAHVEITQGTGIHAAPYGLQPVEQAHGRDLGRSRHGARRKSRSNQVEAIVAPAEFPGHGRNQLENRCVTLHRHQFGYIDAAQVTNSAQVVAHQVDDHEVLGPIFFRARQLGLQRRILVGRATPGPGSLDGPALHVPLGRNPEKALGRTAEDRDLAEIHETREGRR